MKRVKCIESGEIFESVKDAAEHFNVSPALIVHVLKGRQKSAKGRHFEYYGENYKIKQKRTVRKKAIKDDIGRIYESIKHLADAKGVSERRARYLIDRDGVFRNACLTPERITVSPRYVVNGIPLATRKQFVSYLSQVPRQILYNALDFDVSVVLYVGATGWCIERETNDLFAEIKNVRAV